MVIPSSKDAAKYIAFVIYLVKIGKVREVVTGYRLLHYSSDGNNFKLENFTGNNTVLRTTGNDEGCIACSEKELYNILYSPSSEKIVVDESSWPNNYCSATPYSTEDLSKEEFMFQLSLTDISVHGLYGIELYQELIRRDVFLQCVIYFENFMRLVQDKKSVLDSAMLEMNFV